MYRMTIAGTDYLPETLEEAAAIFRRARARHVAAGRGVRACIRIHDVDAAERGAPRAGYLRVDGTVVWDA
jgi:hypothetical protein